MFSKIKEADFSNLNDLNTIFSSSDIIIAHGIYDNDQTDPGAHITVTSPKSKKMYDFIKVSQNSYILKVLDRTSN